MWETECKRQEIEQSRGYQNSGMTRDTLGEASVSEDKKKGVNSKCMLDSTGFTHEPNTRERDT